MTHISETRRRILNHPDGPTMKQLDSWQGLGLLQPIHEPPDKSRWRGKLTWPLEEREVAVIMARLYRVGFKPGEAARLARIIVKRRERENPVRLRLDSGITFEIHLPLRTPDD